MKILAPFSLVWQFGYSFGYSRTTFALVPEAGAFGFRAGPQVGVPSRKRVSTSVLVFIRPCHSWHGCAGDRRGRSPTGG